MSAATSDHPSARRMRQVAESVAAGDVAGALAHFPAGVVWYWPAERKEDRVYRGHEGLMQFFGRLAERSNGTMRPEVEDVLGSDRHWLDVLVAHFATVGADGFERNWFLPSDVAAWNRFFG